MLAPLSVAAQGASLSGTWRHRGGETEREQRHQAIDEATEDMGFMIRGPARDRLRSVTTPKAQLTLQENGDSVTLGTGERRITLPTDGTATTVSGENGEATMRASWRDGRLVVSASREGGSRTTVYHLSEDGQRLTVLVRMTSDRLGEPLRYRAHYRRD